MVKQYTGTYGDGARVFAAMEKACKEVGLPWDSIFGSMGDEHSKMRKAAIVAWNMVLFNNATVLTHGDICYEARKPVVPMSFRQGADWCGKNCEVVLSLYQVSQVPGLLDDLLGIHGANCRVVDLTGLQGNKYHIASIRDLMASRHIQADENFGPDDVIIVRLDPPSSPIKQTYIGTDELPVFEVVADITFGELHRHLRRCGCGLARDADYLEAGYSFQPDTNIFVRGELMFVKYSQYNGAKELHGTIDSDSAIIRAGGYVIGKRIPGETKHMP